MNEMSDPRPNVTATSSVASPLFGEPTRALDEECGAMAWLLNQTASTGVIPMLEARAIIASFVATRHAYPHAMLPLVRVDGPSRLAAHAVNVATLCLALADSLHVSGSDARELGLAALLHDVGKVRVPSEVDLQMPDALAPADLKRFELHPIEGARLILRADSGADFAALVAYEHHWMLDGTGYPASIGARGTWWGTGVVQVCNEYERVRALNGHSRALAMLGSDAGTRLDAGIVQAFTLLLRAHELDVARTHHTQPAPLSESA